MRSRVSRTPAGRGFLGLVTVLLCAALFATSAEAAWIEPLAVSTEGLQARDPQVAVDGSGNVTVAWVSGTSSQDVFVAEHPAGGAWTNPVARISDPTPSNACDNPRLAVNSAGAAILVADCGSGATVMRAAERTVNGTWGISGEIPGTGNGSEPRVGIDENRNKILVWSGPASTVQSAYRPVASAWSSVVQLSTASKVAFEPNVAMSHDGYAFAIWREERKLTGPDPVIEVRVARHESMTWTASGVLTNNFSTTPITTGEPQISINSADQKLAAWSIVNPGVKEFMEGRASGSALAGWEPGKSISESTAHVELPRIALGGNGLGLATWRSWDPETGVFRIKAATTSSLGGSWSAPETLDDSGAVGLGSEPAVATDAAGDGAIVWGAGATTKAASHSAAGAFGVATPISNSAHTFFEGPQVTMDSGGDTIAVWSANDMTSTHIAVAVDDVTPPAISFTPPAPVVAGNAVGLNAVATDAWSPSSLSWDFGDGATATGSPVSHVYATAGVKTATVTATDAAGNSSSAAIPVTVTAAPESNPPPPPPPHKVVLTATVPAQTWKQIAKAKVLKLRCKLDVSGSCAAKASIAASVAKRIGFKVGKNKKKVPVGKGFATTRAGQFVVVKVKLTGKALADIAAATKPVPVAFAVTGSAGGSDPTTVLRRLKISRP